MMPLSRRALLGGAAAALAARPVARVAAQMPMPLPRRAVTDPTVAFGYSPTDDAYSAAVERQYRSAWQAFTGNAPAIRNFVLDLDTEGDFPAGQLDNVYAAGMVPMLTFSTGQQHPLAYFRDPTRIITTLRESPDHSGRYPVTESIHSFFTRWVYGDAANPDRYPGALRWTQRTGRTVLFRFNWEFNIEAFAWSVPTLARYGWQNTPADWKAVWNQVREYFAVAPGVQFVWCPHAEELDKNGGIYSTPVEQFYVPDTSLDWVGMDGFSFGPWTRDGYAFPWRSFDTIFRPTADKLTARYPQKPQIMAEVAVNHATNPANPETQTAARWMRDAFTNAGTGTPFAMRYPLVRAVCWYNRDRRADEAAPDWRIANLDNGVAGVPRAMAGYPGGADDPTYDLTVAPAPERGRDTPITTAQVNAFREMISQPYFQARL